MLVVGLTGNIASGKSRVASRLASLGAVVIDADHLARRVVEPGSEGLREIVRRWGRGILRPDGSLDRGALRAIVFASDPDREALNAIVHPRVEALRQEELARARRDGVRVVICDIPLLFETHLESQFDVVVVVDAPEGIRASRLRRDRGLSDSEAAAMMAAQMPASEKRRGAHVVIENGGDLPALYERVDALWERWTSDPRATPAPPVIS